MLPVMKAFPCLLIPLLLQPAIAAAVSDNIALGKRYTFEPAPGYAHCTDPDDMIQLTDGQYTDPAGGQFWTQKSTVGWVRVPQVVITIDLEDHTPIRGMSVSSAAGSAGVNFPRSIHMLVSVDGRAFHNVGDLVRFSEKRQPAPPYGDTKTHCFATDELRTHGRYVKLLIEVTPNLLFIDEIEVHRGDEAWKNLPLPGEAVQYPPTYFGENVFNTALKRRIGLDLDAARTAVATANPTAELRAKLDDEVTTLDEEIRRLPSVDPQGFRGTFPLNDTHARIYAIHGALRAVAGLSPLIAWSANTWDFLSPTDLPEQHTDGEIFVAAMRGETRAAALNLTNCTDRPLDVLLTFEGLPGGAVPAYIRAHEVAWTDTRESVAVAAALPEIAARENGWALSVPAGMTRQVWFSFSLPRDMMTAGAYRGRLVITASAEAVLQVPVALRVFDIEFPSRPRLHVGGWDYSNAYLYGLTRENRDAIVTHLQDRFVDSPWATNDALPFGDFDDMGDMIKPPDTANFDAWVSRWPEARRYMVFHNRRGIGGSDPGDPLFAGKVAAWINFWVAYAQSRGVPPERLFLLLLDEPGNDDADRIILAWSRAIKAVQPGVVIWDDGTREPARNTPEMMAALDVLCPHLPNLLEGKADADFYRHQRDRGRRLDLYSCRGPVRLLDPYAYHRLQAWSCFQLGAEATMFWSFIDTGGGSSWNEYLPMDAPYAPFFPDGNSVTPGKHMEAIRESVGDFEYLAMLEDAITRLEAQHDQQRAAQGRTLLIDSIEGVLSSLQATELKWPKWASWQTPRDRSQADLARVRIGAWLEANQP